MKLTRLQLLKYVDYDPETGVFTWLERTEEMVASKPGRTSFNSQYAGKPAGSLDMESGNIRFMIEGKYRYAKNMAWLAMRGKVPARIMHRDGDKTSIKWANLTTQKVLQTERKAAEKAEFVPEVRPGVVYFGYKGAYRASFHLAFVTIVVGYYKTAQGAVEAIASRKMEMGI